MRTNPSDSRWLGAAIGWTVGCVVLLSMPPSTIPRVTMPYLDKIVHLTMFFGLGLLWSWALPVSHPRRVTLILGLLFAGASEWLQTLLPWVRAAELLDAAADVLGLVLGVWSAGLRHEKNAV